ncbi:Uncharacterized protein TCM_025151 [Theobroma cacao]|uniref:Uncharacterized protein n=1 Tax=Theobroma cacao TaxID=3641 RepID=A0A061F5I5_THECC|nr:Uncharacterized protein TCM_025151 [Theobroma cacao]
MTLLVNVNKYYKKKRERVGCAKALRWVKFFTLTERRRRQSSRRRVWKRRFVNKRMVTKLMQLKVEMEEVREQQICIKEGQRKVKENFEAVESECRNLHAETMIIMKQSACTRLRLCIMFQILKARENNDFAKAAALTQALRLVPYSPFLFFDMPIHFISKGHASWLKAIAQITSHPSNNTLQLKYILLRSKTRISKLWNQVLGHLANETLENIC